MAVENGQLHGTLVSRKESATFWTKELGVEDNSGGPGPAQWVQLFES